MNTQGMTHKKWRALVRNLRKRFPVDWPVIVRRCPCNRNCGVVTFDGRMFRIYVDSQQPKTGQVDTLIHEWAHIRTIAQAYSHGANWGVNHAEIYSAWLLDFRPEKEQP